ncbi:MULTISPECIES: hypothetical protein [unclassified Rathayibacter]|uniref:hypothetical protein n=1 Tax=unclassified Rathayibacter TaxID=2609250 RepID=UPI000CE92469|nr:MULTISPECIES: hypothetical protein [unclassified Rathayibacter]PPF16877.1 hypothetical protein C5B92_11025 [Rathayibacter sp. AY1A4]PPG80890.1 hypothetical protein C5C52_09785 [Rathayibacter sp. AY1E5]PPH30754.1 hypothetical protein C5C94_10070 [Rathayibacter sp. AY1C3]PPH31294.1 hypothetical protein C5C37_02010 [Rathayibacter sp. AY1F9]PPH59666.1 hypothetical protein C5D25_12745 [Rathayibacter sp. AY1D7]
MTTIEELRLALVPVFEAMLHEDERSSLRLHFVRLAEWPDGSPLSPADRLEDGSVVAQWVVLGETGSSRELQSGVSVFVLALAVQSDLQDFIAESVFGWGQLRGT